MIVKIRALLAVPCISLHAPDRLIVIARAGEGHDDPAGAGFVVLRRKEAGVFHIADVEFRLCAAAVLCPCAGHAAGDRMIRIQRDLGCARDLAVRAVSVVDEFICAGEGGFLIARR